MRRLLLILLLAAAFCGLFCTPALAYSPPAQMMAAEWFGPHASEVTGEMVQAVWRWYGIPPHILLTIMAAETSLGDPALGGRLISEGHNNYGCIKWMGAETKWGCLASGSVIVAGKTWYSFPDAWTGIAALGRYLKVGPGGNPGYYLRCFYADHDWYEAFAAVYYGRTVSGYSAYLRNIRALDARFCATARKHGWLW
jgi:hypothetical protein